MSSTFAVLSVDAGRKLYRRLGYSVECLYSENPARSRCCPFEGNAQIASAVRNAIPIMFARLGVSEANILLNYLEIEELKHSRGVGRIHALFQGKRSGWDSSAIALLEQNAGFFSQSEDDYCRFARDVLDAVSYTDWLGVWQFVPGEALLSDLYCPKAAHFDPTGLEPYYFDQPWSAELRGKRVLVIHPFAATITAQFKKRKLLFRNPDVLPDFELLTISAVQSLAGNAVSFSSWFEALAFMKTQIDELDFDVALIGAGAYGVPLCAHVKKKGKTAIQIGGALQILFGIKGRRWDNMPSISKLYNEHWVRPSASEQIPSADKIEGGCYW